MRILMLHNRYQFPSGEEVVVKAEQALLESNGHSVRLLEADNSTVEGTFRKAQAALNVVYSQTSKQWIKDTISEFQPDIVHVHNFFPLLSPSVYFACNEARIPVVQTLHNYRILCAIASFYRDGRICEDCLGKPFGWPSVIHQCYRGSRAGSAAVSAMASVHRWLGTWTERVNAYICLTEFARQKFIQGGLPAKKLFVKPNFVYAQPQSLKINSSDLNSKSYALYIGRLHQEKGISTLLTAWKNLDIPLKLKIVGEGPLTQQVTEKAQLIPGIELLGKQPSEKVRQLTAGAQFLIVPSEWYETFGLVVIEAFSVGTPVVASKIGALAELINSGQNGLQFRPGDAEDLAVKIKWVVAHPEELAQMGQRAYADFKEKYTPESNYHQLMDIYKNVLTHL
jgi:glycosyltransferase involved in cell wall biosynthesis